MLRAHDSLSVRWQTPHTNDGEEVEWRKAGELGKFDFGLIILGICINATEALHAVAAAAYDSSCYYCWLTLTTGQHHAS